MNRFIMKTRNINSTIIITILIILIELLAFNYGCDLIKKLHNLEASIEIYECNIDLMDFEIKTCESDIKLIQSCMDTCPEQFADLYSQFYNSYKALKNKQVILKDEIFQRKLIHNEQVKLYEESVNKIYNKFFIFWGGFRVKKYELIF